MPIFMPQSAPKQNNDLGTLLQLGQIGAGIMTGGATGALGAASGGIGLMNGQDKPPGGAQPPPSAAGQDGAMGRRMAMQQQDPLMALATAKDALAYQPPDVQKEYGATIDQALKLAQQSRQNARMV